MTVRGPLVVAPKPGWEFIGAGATHGSANPADQDVPILLMGAGISICQPTLPAGPVNGNLYSIAQVYARRTAGQRLEIFGLIGGNHRFQAAQELFLGHAVEGDFLVFLDQTDEGEKNWRQGEILVV